MASRLVAVLLASRIGQDPLTALRAADASTTLAHLAIASLLASVPLTLFYKRSRLQTSPSRSPLQQPSERHNSDQRRTSNANVMTQLTPTSSRKRPSPDDGPHDSAISLPRSLKRQRISPIASSLSGLRLSLPGKDVPMTPPLSAKGPTTMALKLVIPQKQPTHEQQRKLNRRKADAERWKPKLQRPYPRLGEIRTAYPLKLMRHYPKPSTISQPNFVKPKINTSARVSRLLGQFPLMDTNHAGGAAYEDPSPSPLSHVDQAIPLSTLRENFEEPRSAHMGLQANKHITGSEEVQRLAWLAFSLPEEGRIDRGREAMMQSGLITDDLNLEAAGKRNQLPEWKKHCTGRFAKGRKAAG